MHYEKLFPLFTLPLTLLRNKKPIAGMPIEADEHAIKGAT
jgi:hypothetical protein